MSELKQSINKKNIQLKDKKNTYPRKNKAKEVCSILNFSILI